MELFINLTPVICGIVWIFFSFIMNTENFLSALYFKIIPFTTGICSLFVGAKLMGWL